MESGVPLQRHPAREVDASTSISYRAVSS